MKFLEAIDAIVSNDLPEDEAELSVAMAYMQEMLDKLKSIEDAVRSRLETGIDVPNVKLVKGRSVRKLKAEYEKDEESFIEKVVKEYNVPKKALYSKPKLMTALQIMKLVDEPERPGFEAEFLELSEGKDKLVYEMLDEGDF